MRARMYMYRRADSRVGKKSALGRKWSEMAGRLEEKTVDDICEWLEDRGFSENVLQVIRGTSNTLA